MQPIVKWQYEKLEGTLGLLEDHLADPDCLTRKIDFCNQTPEQISRVMNWRPLRDFLAHGTTLGKVKICEAGMNVGAYNVSIFGINPKLYRNPKWMGVLKKGKDIPWAKEIHSLDPYTQINFEVILPSEEPQSLTWNRQDTITEPVFRPPREFRPRCLKPYLAKGNRPWRGIWLRLKPNQSSSKGLKVQ